MKTIRAFTLSLIGVSILSVTLLFTGCQKDENPMDPGNDINTTDMSSADRHGHSPVYPVNGRVFGKTYGEWGAEWWKWNFRFDCAHFPLDDANGSLQNQGQHGPVYFLSGGHFNQPVVRNVTIPHEKSIFFPVICYENDDTAGYAASGMSMRDYLTAGADGPIDGVDIATCTLDGVDLVSNPFDYRAHSPLFNFRGNIDLASCFDNAITGQPQPCVTDGYWFMLKPLSRGNHTLHFTGGISGPGLVMDITYHITQR